MNSDHFRACGFSSLLQTQQGHAEESAPASFALHSSHVSLCRDTGETWMVTSGEQRLQRVTRGQGAHRHPCSVLSTQGTVLGSLVSRAFPHHLKLLDTPGEGLGTEVSC